MDFLSEAFKGLQSLNEETFDLQVTGENDELRDFLDSDDELDTVTIIDDEAETEEDIKDSYVGKVILDCNVCHSLIYKNPDEVIIDDESETANIDEECPFCYSVDGFKIIGQVKPFNQEEAEEEKDSDDEEKSSDEIETEDDGDVIEVEDDEEEKNESLRESILRKQRLKRNARRRLQESRRVRESRRCRIKECGDQNPDEKVDLEADRISNRNKEDAKEISESIENLSLETEDTKLSMESDEFGKVTITTEPKDSFAEEEISGETIGKIEPEVEDEIVSNSEEEQSDEEAEETPDEEPSEDEVEVDQFDEETFESLGEAYLKRVYSNVESFKVSKVYESNSNRLFVEGLITFDSGNTKKTNFVFKNCGVSKRGKTVFEGYNKEITRSNKSFRLKGRIDGKKIVSESLAYRYNQNKKRINGIVK